MKISASLLTGILMCGLNVASSYCRADLVGGGQWKQQFDNPQTVRVRFQGQVNAVGVAGVSLGGIASKATNYFDEACGFTWLDTAPGYVDLRPWQTTPIYIWGTNVYGISVSDISVPTPTPKLGSGGASGEPQQSYRVYIYRTNVTSYVYDPNSQQWNSITGPGWEPFCSNGQQAAWNCESDNNGTCCVGMSRYFWIQVRPDGVLSPAVSGEPSEDQNPWSGENMPVDAPMAAGDEYPLIMSAGNGPTPNVISLEWGVDMGRLWNGASAGKLRFLANRVGTNSYTLDTNTYTPLSLNYSARSYDTNEVRVRKFLTNAAWIQQIKTPQAVMNVSLVTSNSFDLKFYLTSFVTGEDTNGFYLLTNTATPFVVWQFDTPDGTTNRLRIREVRNGKTNATSLGYSSSIWSLTNGTGNEARVQTRTISTNISGGATNRTETLEVKTAGGATSDRTVEAYRDFGWGYVLVGVTNDPGGANLVTSFTYGTDVASSNDYRQVTFVSYPDGYWEQRVYADEDTWANFGVPPGALFRIINPWKDSTTNSPIEDDLVTQLYYYGNKTYHIEKWHDPAFFGEDETSQFFSIVYGELNWNDEDSCGTIYVTTQGKRTGESMTSSGDGTQDDVASYFGPQYGRMAGQLYESWNELGVHDAFDYRFGEWRTSSNVFILGSGTNDIKQIIYHGSLGGDDPLTGGESGLGAEVWITPYRSTKEVKIFDDGYLAAREMYVYTGQLTNFALIDKVVYRRDSLGHATNVFRIDPATLQSRTIYKADWQGTNTWPGDLQISQTDETGATNLFAYDSLKRKTTSTKVGSSAPGYPTQNDIVSSVAYDAAGRARTNAVSGGGLTLRTLISYDLAGRATSVVTPDNLTNFYTYANGGRQTNTTLSSGATITNISYLDRRSSSITGTAVTNQFFDYFHNDWRIRNHPGIATDDGFAFVAQNVTLITEGFTNSLRQLKQISDRRGVPIETRRPGFQNTNEYSNFTFRIWDRNPDGQFETGFDDPDFGLGDIQIKFLKDDYGFTSLQSLIVDQVVGDWTDPASIHRMSSNTWNYATNGSGHWFKVSQKFGLLVDNSPNTTLLQTVKQRLTGFASNEISEMLTYDPNTNLTGVKVTVELAYQKLLTVTNVPESTLDTTNVAINGLLQTETTPSVSSMTWHYYDALGRETSVKDSLGYSQSRTYSATTGQVTSRTDGFGQTTSYAYYPPGGLNAGMIYAETNPAGKKTYYKYNDRGQLIQKWGDVAYPEQCSYSVYGEMTNLITYRAGSGWTGSNWPTNSTGTSDVTAWFFDGPTGLLTNKTDAAGKSVGYNYYNNWPLKTRTWARNVTSTNVYNAVKDLMGINYSDGTTSLIYTNHDRRALPRTVVDSTGTRSLSYDVLGRVTNDGWTNGTFNGLSISNHFHQFYGRDYLKFVSASTNLQQNYAYDTYGRMGSASYGALSATYGYLPNSDLLQSTTFKTNTTTALTTTRAWEYGERLRAIANTTSSSTVTTYSYDYDILQRRTRATWVDGSAWVYDYDDRNELTSAKHYWADFNPVFGQNYEYVFDNIGNRTTNRFGGDAAGANLRAFTYTANNLNQYSNRTVPGYLEVVGAAQATASSVTINGSAADNRKVEYFAEELSVSNGSGPVWQGVTAIATFGGNSTTNTGNVLVPPATQSFGYDLDGNLTNDSVWVYRWDAENRLIQMTNLTTVDTVARKKLVFTYDHLGRRATKKVYLWASTDYSTSPVTDERFVYDGWNLIAQISATNNTPIRSYLWGKDLSGDLDGAGGVGGLLLVTDHQGSGYHFATYDGNGNVTALVKSDGATSANYEFDAFGQAIRVTGQLSKANPFRFSTKFTDDETDLLYYGYRFYHSGLGRWINRDPIGEEGGINLYAAVLNNPITAHDVLGMVGTAVDSEAAAGEGAAMDGSGAGSAEKARRTIMKTLDIIQDTSDIVDAIMAMEDPIAALQQIAELRTELLNAKKAGKLSEGATDLHHLIPQKLRTALGNEVDKFCVALAKRLHQRAHMGKGFGRGGIWNGLWMKFMGGKNPADLKPEDIKSFMNQMAKLFGLDGLDKVHY